MIEHIDFKTARCIIELGGGDGVITKHILKRMHPEAKLITFEILPQFCDLLRKIDDKRLIVAEDSAENIQKYLQEQGFAEADGVVSALPTVNMPKDLAHRIVTASRDSLKLGGWYSQLHYSLLNKDLYEEVFDDSRYELVLVNVPPAFIFYCQKK
jgi:phospholipid N-methyltransferase